MDREATKSRGEREDEEVERLVRPSPKVKPARHDLRRERVEPDDDPDLDNRDKDQSKNFKDIGGSTAARILRRWAANAPGAKATDPQGKKVKVRSKATGWVGKISPEKLKELPGKYELADDSEEETFKGKPKPTAEPKPADKPKPVGKPNLKLVPKPTGEEKEPQAKEPAAQPNVEKDMAARDALRQLAKEDPKFEAFLKSFRRPDSDNSQFAKNNPGYSAKPFMQGRALPEGIKTVSDLARVMSVQGQAPKPKKGPDEAPDTSDSAAERVQLKNRLKEVKEELKEDPKSEGAQKERAAIKEALKATAEREQIMKELAETKAALAELQKKGPPTDEEVEARARESIKEQKQKGKKKPVAPGEEATPGEVPQAAPTQAPAQGAPPQAAPGQQPPQQPGPGQQPPPAQQPAPAQGAPAAKPAQSDDEALEAEITKVWEDAGFNPASASNAVGKLVFYLQGGDPIKPELVDQAIQLLQDTAAKPNTSRDTAKRLKSLAKSLKPRSSAGVAKAKKGPAKAKPTAPEDPNAPKFAPFQPDRPVTEAERQAADRLVMKTFPRELAAKILFANKPRYHPDEIQEMVADYEKVTAIRVPEDISSLVDEASSFYTTDPNNVPAPKMVKDADGNDVEFKSITDPIEGAKAYRKHQVKTVAMSLAAESAVAKAFARKGAPKELADAMSNFALSGSGESPEDRSKRATAEAERLFYGGLQLKSDPSDLSDKQAQKLLKSTKDPDLQKLAVSYCQANDYREARKRFLDPKGFAPISERQSPEAIAKGLGKATEFLRERSKRYPDEATSQDTYTTFRDRVMKHLANLRPDKQHAVQGILDQQDNRHYEQEMVKYKKSAQDYREQLHKASKEFESDYKAYSKKLKESGDVDAEPPPTGSERLRKQKIAAPKPPRKPPRYKGDVEDPEEQAGFAQEIWDDFASRRAAQRVADRTTGHAFSFYSATCAMDRSAVYWGVAPYPKGHEGFEPYRKWQQPQARDLGEPVYTRLLKAAREWLSTPALSTKVEGVVRDTQLRAALDLALRDENYDHAIHPTVYNKLLARLAGVSENETLLTVRSRTARNTMPNNKLQLETAQADGLLARLDRMASVVQSNHGKWGMDFTAAKNLVNAIDKIADDLEAATYGEESLLNRQASEIGRSKLAQVLQRDSDEKYMDTFKNPQQPIQMEADEPYMKAYKSDDSSGVRSGKSTSGRPLAK